MPDEDEFMTTDEFARLPSVVHHAVWAACGRRLSADVIPAGSIFRYRRTRVEEITRELEADRG